MSWWNIPWMVIAIWWGWTLGASANVIAIALRRIADALKARR